jgi:hypothetical protein
MTHVPRYETMVRTYSATSTRQFDREQRELEAQGWNVVSISSRETESGSGLPLVGALMNRPTGALVVTYRRRAD